MINNEDVRKFKKNNQPFSNEDIGWRNELKRSIQELKTELKDLRSLVNKKVEEFKEKTLSDEIKLIEAKSVYLNKYEKELEDLYSKYTKNVYKHRESHLLYQESRNWVLSLPRDKRDFKIDESKTDYFFSKSISTRKELHKFFKDEIKDALASSTMSHL